MFQRTTIIISYYFARIYSFLRATRLFVLFSPRARKRAGNDTARGFSCVVGLHRAIQGYVHSHRAVVDRVTCICDRPADAWQLTDPFVTAYRYRSGNAIVQANRSEFPFTKCIYYFALCWLFNSRLLSLYLRKYTCII